MNRLRHTLALVSVLLASSVTSADLLVSDNFGNQILRYSDSGVFIEVLVSSDAQTNGGLSQPVGMEIDANGDLMVASQGTNAILCYDLEDGSFLGAFASNTTGASFSGPAEIQFGPGGDLFVANFMGASVDSLTPFGASNGAFTSGGPGIAGTASFAFGPDGNLYVGSFNSGNIQVFDGDDGTFIETFAESIPGPTGLIFDELGSLWVASLFTHQIFELDNQGEVVSSFSTGMDTFPSHIVFDGPDLLVALTGAAGVFRFSSDGTSLGPFATGGGLTVPGESFFIETKVLIGDVNLDSVVSLADIPAFVEVLSSGGFQIEADIDQDGDVDLSDIPLFVKLLAGG